MLIHFLTVAFRNMSRAKGESLVTIAGLAAGMTAFLLCMTYILHETSYDRFHARASRIYRISAEYRTDRRAVRAAVTPGPLARVLHDDCPGVERSIRLMSESGSEHSIVTGPEGIYTSQRFIYGEPGLFDVFSYTLERRASGASPLDEPGTAVLCADAAGRYFGSRDPLGKTIAITTDATRTYTVTGIVKPPPGPSHVTFDIIVSMSTLQEPAEYLFSDWKRADFHTYALLVPGVDPAEVEEELNVSMRKYLDADDRSGMRFFLERITSIHLGPKLEEELNPSGRVEDVVLSGLIALFVLLVAVANHMNSIAVNTENRSREAALRIVSGAGKSDLAGQLVVESALTSIMAFLISLSCAELLLPWFGSLMGRSLEPVFMRKAGLFLPFAGISALVGCIAGASSSVRFAVAEPAAALRGAATRVRSGFLSGSTLVMSQFVIAATLAAVAVVAAGQLEFMRKGMDVFQADRIEAIPLGSMGSLGQVSRLKERISGLPGVTAVAVSSFVPGDETVSLYEFSIGGPGSGKIVTMRGASVGAGFLDTYGIPLVRGRDFSDVYTAQDEDEFIINETAARALGWPDPVGKKLSRGYLRGVIIGVARDFPVRSLRDRIEPLFLVRIPARDRYLTVRFDPGDHTEALRRVKTVWREFAPDVSFTPFPLSGRLESLYEPERRMTGLFGAGAAIALILACAGAYGLSVGAGERRRVEIGVRKAFGASRGEIFGMMARKPAAMLSVSFIIAAPLARLITGLFLGAYPYRAPLPLLTLVAGLLAVGAMAGAAAGYPVFRAASENPADILRHE